MNRKTKITIITIGLFIVLFFVTSIINIIATHEHKHYMFSDIKALDVLSPYTTEQIAKDKYLDDVIPINRYTYEVRFSGDRFSVFAYEFENNTECMQYIENRVQMRFEKTQGYHLSSNVFFNTKYIAYSENKLLYIEGPGYESTYEFFDFIEQDFDIYLG